MLLLVYLILTILVGVIANSRGRSAVGWAILSLFVSPLISVIVLLILPNIARSETHHLGVNESIRLHALEIEFGHQIRSHKPPFSSKVVHDVATTAGTRRFTNKTEALAFVAARSAGAAHLPADEAFKGLAPPRRD